MVILSLEELIVLYLWLNVLALKLSIRCEGAKPFPHLKTIIHLCIHLLFASDNHPNSLNTRFLLSLWPMPDINRAAHVCSLCNLDLLVSEASCIIHNVSIFNVGEDNVIVHELEGINWNYIYQRSEYANFGWNLFWQLCQYDDPNVGSHLCTC